MKWTSNEIAKALETLTHTWGIDPEHGVVCTSSMTAPDGNIWRKYYAPSLIATRAPDNEARARHQEAVRSSFAYALAFPSNVEVEHRGPAREMPEWRIVDGRGRVRQSVYASKERAASWAQKFDARIPERAPHRVMRVLLREDD